MIVLLFLIVTISVAVSATLGSQLLLFEVSSFHNVVRLDCLRLGGMFVQDAVGELVGAYVHLIHVYFNWHPQMLVPAL